jgi:hypothetical protein
MNGANIFLTNRITSRYKVLDGSVCSYISCGFWPAVDIGFYGLASRWDKVSRRLRGCAKSLSKGIGGPYWRFFPYYNRCRDWRRLVRLGPMLLAKQGIAIFC